MLRVLVLGAVLAAFWWFLSGYTKPFLLTMGAMSVGLCLLVALRFRTADEEGVPLQLLPGAITYFPWLGWEIVKSSWSVAQIIIDPKLPISPTMTRVRATQRTPIGVNVYANSITLTPGTITVQVDGNEFIVHALTRAGADDIEGGGMDARVNRFEGNA